MSYIGDFAEDYATLNMKFTTVKDTGAPTVLSNSPVISVYKANGTTQSVAGITLVVSFDSVVGLNNVLIDLSSDAFYATGNDYQIVITTGTVDSVSVVGYVVGEFSIENRSDLVKAVVDAIKLETDKLTLGDAGAGQAGSIIEEIENRPTTAMRGTDGVDTTTMRGTDGANTTTPLSAAQVNAQMVDVMVTDTFGEPAQGAPGNTISMEEKISFLYAALINKVDVDATLKEFYNAAGTVIWKKTVSDDNTNYIEAKGATGP